MGLSQFEYQRLLARASIRAQQEPLPKSGCEREGDLHGDISDECRRRGWVAFHGSMAHATHRTLGEPDFVILADKGRTIFVECKRRTGKVTREQAALHLMAEHLGHKVHVVRSFDEFLKACE